MSIHRRCGLDGGPYDVESVRSEPAREIPTEDLVAAVMDLDHARDLGFDINDPQVRRTVVEASKRKRAAREQREADEQAARLEAAKVAAASGEPVPAESVVYYMRVGNRVKIGYSTNLKQRLTAVVPEEVMATEPGGRLLEQVRHRQFAELWVAREWFRLEEPLIGHIARLAKAAA